MKNIIKIIISAFLIILLANGALGYAGMGGNTSNINIPQVTGNVTQIDLNNTTESDQDIIMVQHLIEVDANILKATNTLFIRETLIFRNIGTKDFYGNLKTSIPDGSDNISLARSEMMTGGGMVPIDFSQNGNIVSWKEYVEKNSNLPFLYAVEYSVKQGADGSNTETFSKKLAVPAIINYKYMEKPDLPAIVVKIAKPQESTVKFIDENGNKIGATEVDDKGEIFRFSSPQFKEITVEISQSSAILPGSQNYTMIIVIVIGILIILVFSYPYIKKKLNPDEKISKISKKTEGKTNKNANVVKESAKDNAASSGKYKGKNAEELEDLKKQFLSKIKDLEKKYESGDLLDEEYEDTRSSYQGNLKEIEKMLEKIG
ncbi:MAG: hypothetical protein OIN83_09975 [Candidatus Methanoperedens sp.]|nr:hypothetical protein [Candidatus Methanoperedens sp.]